MHSDHDENTNEEESREESAAYATTPELDEVDRRVETEKPKKNIKGIRLEKYQLNDEGNIAKDETGKPILVRPHTIIKSKNTGEEYELLGTFNKEEAQALDAQSGTVKKPGKVDLKRGNEGRIRFARRKSDGRLLIVKKLKDDMKLLDGSMESEFHTVLKDTKIKGLALELESVQSKTRKNEKTIYQFMEFANLGDAENFSELLAGLEGKEKNLVVKYIAASVIATFAELHAKKIYHGDIKPANILITSDGQVLISDFSATVQYDQEMKTRIHQASTTQSAQSSYNSPELTFLIKNKQPIPGVRALAAVDAWKLGLTLMELIDQKFVKDELLQDKEGTRTPEYYTNLQARLKEKLVGTPPDLSRIIVRLLDPNPETRMTVARANRLLKPLSESEKREAMEVIKQIKMNLREKEIKERDKEFEEKLKESQGMEAAAHAEPEKPGQEQVVEEEINRKSNINDDYESVVIAEALAQAEQEKTSQEPVIEEAIDQKSSIDDGYVSVVIAEALAQADAEKSKQESNIQEPSDYIPLEVDMTIEEEQANSQANSSNRYSEMPNVELVEEHPRKDVPYEYAKLPPVVEHETADHEYVELPQVDLTVRQDQELEMEETADSLETPKVRSVSPSQQEAYEKLFNSLQGYRERYNPEKKTDISETQVNKFYIADSIYKILADKEGHPKPLETLDLQNSIIQIQKAITETEQFAKHEKFDVLKKWFRQDVTGIRMAKQMKEFLGEIDQENTPQQKDVRRKTLLGGWIRSKRETGETLVKKEKKHESQERQESLSQPSKIKKC